VAVAAEVAAADEAEQAAAKKAEAKKAKKPKKPKKAQEGAKEHLVLQVLLGLLLKFINDFLLFFNCFN
jgi:hypothetical protein